MARGRLGTALVGPGGEEFLLKEFLGAGAFGEVYLAEGTVSHSIAAAKLLPMNGIDSQDLRGSLVNEAQLAQQVAHRNVVNVLHVGQHDELGPYLLMEYVAGQTLKEFLLNRRAAEAVLPVQAAVDMMLHIAQGARAINEKLVHRDIKPDNILLAGNVLKISDFGLSKLVAERTRTRTFKGIGPIMYMAPEAWQYETNTPKMDVYSVGLVFYQILTLDHPLRDKLSGTAPVEAWRRAHLFCRTPEARELRSDAPLQLSQLLSRMVAKRADDRPEWDEIIDVLSGAREEAPWSDGLTRILDGAVARREKVEQQRLAEQQREEREREIQDAYLASFGEALAQWDALVGSFNAAYQGGEIRKEVISSKQVVYSLPNAPLVSFSLFPRRESGIEIGGGHLVGGAFVGIRGGPSANLLLVRESTHDLYGRWLGCLVEISAVVPAQNALSTLAQPPSSVPFGFRCESDFYQEIGYARSGVMHVFTYKLCGDLKVLFTNLLEVAFRSGDE